MRRTLIATIVSSLAVAACNDTSTQTPANHKVIRVRAPEQDRLHELDAFDLAIALKRAIYDAGYTCKRVTDGGFVGEYKNLDMWMAHCEYDKGSARDWAVFTGPDGGAQVRDCKDIPGSGLPECKVQKKPTGSFTELKAAPVKSAR